MPELRKYVEAERTRYTLWIPGVLWNRLVAHYLSTEAGLDSVGVGQLINRWIEAGLDREQPEYHELDER